VSALARVDGFLYKIERHIVAWSLVAMGIVAVLDVVQRVATRQNGLAERFVRWCLGFLDDAAAQSAAKIGGPVLIAILFLLFAYGVMKARGMTSKPKALGLSVIFVGAAYGLLELFVYLVPNGLIWSQTLGLALMVWAGFVGASLAARARRHLSLEVGPKLFPEAARKYVVALGHLATAGFTIFLAALAVWSVFQHHNDWTTSNYEGGTFPSLAIPKWAAFLAIPYGLAVMALRVLGDMAATLRGEDTSGDEVATFKKMGGVHDDAGGAGAASADAGAKEDRR
jgi:C4-dicarboxylate transporter DctQ subunit